MCLALAVTVSVAPPHYNWDVLGYAGVARTFLGADPAAAHRLVYDDARRILPEERYRLVTEGDAYRRQTASDPEAFRQQLPLYAVKPAYPAGMALLTAAGMDPIGASVLISRIGYVAVGAVTMLWLAHLLPIAAAAALALLVAWLPFVVDLGRLSTPDGVSAAVVLSALLALYRSRESLAGALFVASVFVRPDNVLWLPALALYRTLAGVGSARGSAAWLALGVAAFLAVTRLSGHYGWAVTFYVSFVDRLPYPADAVTASLPEILSVYLRRSHPANLPAHFLLISGIGAAALRATVRRTGVRSREAALLAMGLAVPVLHWLAYPSEQRFFVAAYILVLLGAVATVVDGAVRPGSAGP